MLYFDNAATSFPKPPEVIRAVTEVMVEYGANPGRSGHQLALRASRGIFNTRMALTRLFHIANPLDLIFTFNCTESLNLALKGLLKPGDHVVTTSMEHNSVLRPLAFLNRQGIELTMVQADGQGRIRPEQIEQAILPTTRLIVMTHVSNLTGTIMPVAEVGELARDRDIFFLVDAAQSAGVYPIDVEELGIDLLAFPGHKGLLGPQGTGGLYIREGVELQELMQGGTGSISHSLNQPDAYPDKFESGTPNAPGLIGLGAGVEYLLHTGLDVIRQKEEDLTFAFIEGASRVPGIKLYGTLERGSHAPVVALNIGERDSSEVAYILDQKFGIAVRPGLHCAPMAHQSIGTFKQGAIRFSFGHENTFEEVEQAIRALHDIAAEA